MNKILRIEFKCIECKSITRVRMNQEIILLKDLISDRLICPCGEYLNKLELIDISFKEE